MFQDLRKSFINNISGEYELNKFFDVETTSNQRRIIQTNWLNHDNIYKHISINNCSSNDIYWWNVYMDRK